MAEELYVELEKANIKTFFSVQSLGILGADRYKEMIDTALDECSILIVVGTSVENIQSSWVRYEWDSFYSDILMEKKRGKVFSYIDDINPHDLPRTLRNLQCFEKKYFSIDSIIHYVENALKQVKNGKYLQPEKTDVFLDNHNVSKLLQFANLISCGDHRGQYINPYISEEMADLIAKSVKSLREYNTERCRNEGINPVVYEVFLAQKIARINKPESCIKAYKILHQVGNSWRVFLNDNYQVVAYWIFIALEKTSYDKIKMGQVDEKDISLEDVRFIDMPGRYKGYLLLSGTIEEFRIPWVVKELY